MYFFLFCFLYAFVAFEIEHSILLGFTSLQVESCFFVDIGHQKNAAHERLFRSVLHLPHIKY